MPLALAYFRAKCCGQRQHVVRPLAQRRELQVDDVEAVEEILAERPLLHLVGKVAVGGREDADVDRHRPGAADAVDHALLDGAQQLGLQAHVHLGDLVEQQRAAVGLLELADAARDGAGEGALLVAEELALQQVFGDRGAVDRDEGRVAPVRLHVDVARHHLLAGAAFAGDQDRGVGRRDLVGEADHGLHRRVADDEVGLVVGDGGEDRGDQLGVGRQRDVFLGAGVDGGDRGRAHRCRRRRRRPATWMRSASSAATRSRDVERHVDHQQVGRRARRAVPQRRPRRRATWTTLAPRSMAILVAAVSWPFRVPDDQELHRYLSPLMISVIVTPSLSSTSTISPRATSRSLT